MRLTASLRSFFATFRIAFRSGIESRLNLVFLLVNTVVVMGVLFVVFQSAFAKTDSIHGVTFAAAIWSLSMYSIAWGFGARNMYGDTSDGIENGSIETRLVRPQHYLSYIVAFRLGKQFLFFILQIIVNLALLFWLVGLPPISGSVMWWLSIISLFAGGMMLSIFLYSCIGLTAFWIQNPMPVMWIVDKGVMILGGSFVPVALLPAVVRRFSEWSPFGAIMSFSQAFTPDFESRFWSLFIPQLIWIVIIGLLLMVLWTQGRKKIAINGG